MVIPFDQCIARPSDGNRKYPLKAHLKNVALGWGVKGKSYQDNLFYLGGLCHDIGKAQPEWQMWAKGDKDIKRPDHARIGSFIFIQVADKYLEVEGLNKQKYASIVIDISNDIRCHHSKLKDIAVLDKKNLPWSLHTKDIKGLDSIDFDGFEEYIYEQFPKLKDRLDFNKNCRNQSRYLIRGYLTNRDNFKEMYQLQEATEKALRKETASFIYADRFDASGFEKVPLATSRDFKVAKINLENQCKNNKKEHIKMNKLRDKVQDMVLQNYLKNADSRIYTLFLPTGYGKTIASLKVALEACGSGKTNRIIYVAPYISILSQATSEIEKLTKMDVIEHHYLSTVERDIDERKLFILDTWQNPIVTTTSNQLFRTIFPTRAQHTMKLKSLKNSFIIIDEPQIISSKVWNAFLAMIDCVTREMNAKVLFITATMPPTKYGLFTKLVKLEPDNIKWLARYDVHLENKVIWDEEKLAIEVEKELKNVNHIAVVLNTIKDSVKVYKRLKKRLEKEEVKIINLHGLMLPGHKSKIIEEVKNITEKDAVKIVLVSTQIIEAGVDLSFNTIFRALPITPSVGQTAGRANRHDDDIKGRIIVFDFRRSGKEDTRAYVYREQNSRDITDQWFYNDKEKSRYNEKDLYKEIEKYYDETFAYNEQRASLKYILDAGSGRWTSFQKLQQPFESNYEKYAVFIPKENYIDTKTKNLMEAFKVQNLKQLYDKYKDKKWLAKLDFLSTKKFMGLLNNFIVNIDEKAFNYLLENEKVQKDSTIFLLTDLQVYNDETGLGGLK